jgi:hypothetical protein
MEIGVWDHPPPGASLAGPYPRTYLRELLALAVGAGSLLRRAALALLAIDAAWSGGGRADSKYASAVTAAGWRWKKGEGLSRAVAPNEPMPLHVD